MGASGVFGVQTLDAESDRPVLQGVLCAGHELGGGALTTHRLQLHPSTKRVSLSMDGATIHVKTSAQTGFTDIAGGRGASISRLSVARAQLLDRGAAKPVGGELPSQHAFCRDLVCSYFGYPREARHPQA